MAKIQTAALQQMPAVSRTDRHSAVKSDTGFDQLLKDRGESRPESRSDDAVSQDSSRYPNTGIRRQGGRTETKAQKEDGSLQTEAEEALSSEMLLKLQELAGQTAVMPTEEGTAAEELTAAISGLMAEEGLPGVLEENQAAVTEAGQFVPESAAAEAGIPASDENADQLFSLQEEGTAAYQSLQTAKDGADVLAEQQIQTTAKDNGIQKREEIPSEVRVSDTNRNVVENAEGVTDRSSVRTEDSRGGEPEEQTGKEFEENAAQQGVQYLQRANMHLKTDPMPETGVLKSEPSTLPEDLGQYLSTRLPKQNGVLTIELEPATLGKLTIRVLYEDSKALVSILSSNPKTLEILNQKASELASILEEHTGQETVVYTEQPEQQQPYDERQGQSQGRQEGQEHKNRREQEQQETFAQQLRLGLV